MVGFVGLPGKRDLKYVRATLVRLVSNIPSTGTVRKLPGVAAVSSNVFRRSPTSGHARFRHLSFAISLLPIFRDSVDGSGSLNIMPSFLGAHDGMLRRPKLEMAKFYMNPKFGPKTRPC